MKYLAFTSTLLSLASVALLMVIGIQLDVLLAGMMGLYMATMAVAILAFIFSLLTLVRSLKDQKSGTANRDAD